MEGMRLQRRRYTPSRWSGSEPGHPARAGKPRLISESGGEGLSVDLAGKPAPCTAIEARFSERSERQAAKPAYLPFFSLIDWR